MEDKSVSYWSKMSKTQKQIAVAITTTLVYALVFNWTTSAMVIGSILIHELFHLIAMKYHGYETDGILIWLGGGVTSIKGRIGSYDKWMPTALAGAAGGGLVGAILVVVYLAVGGHLLGNIATFMIWFNLFNLLPLTLLDGGVIMNAVGVSISEKVNYLIKISCHAVAFAMLLVYKHPVIATLLAINFTLELFGKIILEASNIKIDKPEPLSKPDILITLGAYIFTVGVLICLQQVMFPHTGYDVWNMFRIGK